MSNSYRKNMHCGNCAESDKKGKKIAARRYRSYVKLLVSLGCEDSIVEPKYYVSCWSFPKDGKFYFGHDTVSEDIRKKLLRK